MGDDSWVIENDGPGGIRIRRARPEDYEENLRKTVGILNLPGWIALDDDYSIWFFPGKDNKPEKIDGEWQGFCPILLEKEDRPLPEILKDQPLRVNFTTT